VKARCWKVTSGKAPWALVDISRLISLWRQSDPTIATSFVRLHGLVLRFRFSRLGFKDGFQSLLERRVYLEGSVTVGLRFLGFLEFS